jgi:hypothetical protein
MGVPDLRDGPPSLLCAGEHARGVARIDHGGRATFLIMHEP